MKKEILNVREAFDLSGDLLCGNIEQCGIFLNAALRELREAYETVTQHGWREVNASLVLLEHAKKEFDGLETKFNKLHHLLDKQAMAKGKEERLLPGSAVFKLPPVIRRKAKKKIEEALHFIDSAEKKQRKVA